MRRITSICIIVSFLVGCATHPNQIKATHVSPIQYQGYTCDQILEELIRINQEVLKATGVQESQANRDIIAVTIGMLLFWPALFLLFIRDDKKEELARLKGEHDALEKLSAQKECNTSIEYEYSPEPVL